MSLGNGDSHLFARLFVLCGCGCGCANTSTCMCLHVQQHLPSVHGRAKCQGNNKFVPCLFSTVTSACALAQSLLRKIRTRFFPCPERGKPALGLLGRQFPVQLLMTGAPSSGVSGAAPEDSSAGTVNLCIWRTSTEPQQGQSATISPQISPPQVTRKVYFHVIDAVKLNWREQPCVTQAEELLYMNSSSQVPCARPFLREEGVGSIKQPQPWHHSSLLEDKEHLQHWGQELVQLQTLPLHPCLLTLPRASSKHGYSPCWLPRLQWES